MLKIDVDESEARLNAAEAEGGNDRAEKLERRKIELKKWRSVEALAKFEKSIGFFEEKRLSNYTVTTNEQRAVIRGLTAICETAGTFHANPFNLLLCGPIGTGKDHLITSVARVMVKSGVSVKYVLGEDFFAHCADRISRGESDEQFFQTYLKPDLLIFSDPVRKRWLPINSDGRFKCAAFDKFGAIVKRRYLAKKKIWLTANLFGRDWKEANKSSTELFGPDVWRRITEDARVFWTGWGCYSTPGERIGTYEPG